MDNDSSLKTDRTYRRQVRERYYRREEDFATLDEYNDYLEEVEDLIVMFSEPETRKQAVQRLDALAKAHAQQNARNRAKLEADIRSMEQTIKAEKDEAKERLRDREAAEARAQEALRAERATLQNDIAAGRTSIADADAAYRRHVIETAREQAASGRAGYAPSAPAGPSQQPQRRVAQLLEPQSAKVLAMSRPREMQVSTQVAGDAYEKDAALFLRVQRAGGVAASAWRQKFSQLAFDESALQFVPAS